MNALLLENNSGEGSYSVWNKQKIPPHYPSKVDV